MDCKYSFDKIRGENIFMHELEKAIQKISYMTKKFPKEEFKIITENKESAIP